ncbi:MAG: type II toxin-antitoxin system VapC family toxin [Niveispirillum sp.]|uniref:type II toxin-antitoxin system VapC family toxin n=1 Tax=Niveispirillum sp. TaxID=1917217 RepID=UPI003BA48A72
MLEKAFELFGRMRIDYYPVDVTATLGLAEVTGLTFYDASYLWLAKYKEAQLITLDHMLSAKGQSMVTIAPINDAKN